MTKPTGLVLPPRFDPHVPWITGRYYDNYSGTISQVSVGADTLRATYLYLPDGEGFDQIAINVSVGASAGKLARLGVYAIGADGYPSTLLIDGGAVAIDATGDRTVSITTPPPGGQWYAIASLLQESATIAVVQATHAQSFGRASAGVVSGISVFKTSVSYGALPSPFPSSPTVGASNAPLHTVRAI